jgi:hypothetical protein
LINKEKAWINKMNTRIGEKERIASGLDSISRLAIHKKITNIIHNIVGIKNHQ